MGNKSNQNFAKYMYRLNVLAFVWSGSVIAVLPLNGGQGEVTLTQTPNPYLHLDPISRNISITKELDTDKDDNGNKMSNIILQVMCMPSGSTRKVRYSYLKGEKYLPERWELSIWKMRNIYMKSENYFHERCIIFTPQVRFLWIHIVRVQCHLHF